MSLVNELIKGLLPEEEGKKTVGIYAGGFKPPTKGHFQVLKEALDENPEMDEVIVYVGKKERNGVSQEISLDMWEIYGKHLPFKVKYVAATKPPIQLVYNYAKENPNTEVLWIIGAREENEDDFKDIASRTKGMSKYPNLELRTIVTTGGVSGTAARNAAKVSPEKLNNFLPDFLSDKEKTDIFVMLNNIVTESLNENASYSQHIDIWDKIDQLNTHMVNKGMNVEPLPTTELINGDSENAKEFLGKTAYYDPNNKHIVLYTEGRHPKDIVRSYAHEMIHHIQNLEGRLGNIQTTNTHEDDNLNKIEAEANLKGTMTFRNWTDSLNESLNESSQPTFTMYSGITGDAWEKIWKNKNFIDKATNVTNDEDFALDYSYNFKTGKYEDKYVEISNIPLDAFVSVRDRDYEDDDDFESIGDLDDGKKINAIKFNDLFLVNLFPYKSQIKTTLIDNSLNEAIVGDKIECDNCSWSWNIVDGGDDLFICHKCGHDNEQVNETKDPFGLNAYAMELGRLREEETEYQIYCDMDGVLADFELGYKELTGINLQVEKPEGAEFWDPIQKAGVGFWAGLKWMPDGQQLWGYIKDKDTKLLSAPSRDQSSRIGKHVWVKHKIPGTKLILRYASQKQELATPNSILIDDRKPNIDQWEAAGGIGILHTNTADTIKQLQKLGL